MKNKNKVAGIGDVVGSVKAQVSLDDLDVELLIALSDDARSSQRSLAKILGVSTPTVSERMTKLERAGVIRGYAADIDWSAVGFGETIFMSINSTAEHDLAKIMEKLWDIPEVEAIHLITGELDLLVQLRVRESRHLKKLMMKKLWQIPGIQRSVTMTSVAEMPHKNFTAELLRSIQTAPEAD